MIVTAKFGSEIVISPDGRSVDVTALAGGGFAAGWAEQNQTITSARALFLDSFGQVAGPEILLFSPAVRVFGPELATLTGGGFAATWTMDNGMVSRAPHVGGRMVSAAGVAGPSFTPTESQFSEQADIAGLPNGGFVEVWVDRPTFDTAILKGRLYDSAGARVLSPFVIDDTGFANPAVAAAADGTFAVAWYGTGLGDVSGGSISARI